MDSTLSPIPCPCYTILRGLKSVEVRLRFFLRSTRTPIPYPCYTILRALRSLEDYLEVDLIAHTLFLLHYSERLEVC